MSRDWLPQAFAESDITSQPYSVSPPKDGDY
jgi:hypothetical protein